MKTTAIVLLAFASIAATDERPRAATHGATIRSPSGMDSISRRETPAPAREVVAFWREAGPGLWFAKDAEFDRLFRDRFLALHEAAARRELDTWAQTPDGSLALLILLDQFPRNAFRDTPRMYSTDDAGARSCRRGHRCRT